MFIQNKENRHIDTYTYVLKCTPRPTCLQPYCLPLLFLPRSRESYPSRHWEIPRVALTAQCSRWSGHSLFSCRGRCRCWSRRHHRSRICLDGGCRCHWKLKRRSRCGRQRRKRLQLCSWRCSDRRFCRHFRRDRSRNCRYWRRFLLGLLIGVGRFDAPNDRQQHHRRQQQLGFRQRLEQRQRCRYSSRRPHRMGPRPCGPCLPRVRWWCRHRSLGG